MHVQHMRRQMTAEVESLICTDFLVEPQRGDAENFGQRGAHSCSKPTCRSGTGRPTCNRRPPAARSLTARWYRPPFEPGPLIRHFGWRHHELDHPVEAVAMHLPG